MYYAILSIKLCTSIHYKLVLEKEHVLYKQRNSYHIIPEVDKQLRK